VSTRRILSEASTDGQLCLALFTSVYIGPGTGYVRQEHVMHAMPSTAPFVLFTSLLGSKRLSTTQTIRRSTRAHVEVLVFNRKALKKECNARGKSEKELLRPSHKKQPPKRRNSSITFFHKNTFKTNLNETLTLLERHINFVATRCLKRQLAFVDRSVVFLVHFSVFVVCL